MDGGCSHLRRTTIRIDSFCVFARNNALVIWKFSRLTALKLVACIIKDNATAWELFPRSYRKLTIFVDRPTEVWASVILSFPKEDPKQAFPSYFTWSDYNLDT
jgi:hypothetical protein